MKIPSRKFYVYLFSLKYKEIHSIVLSPEGLENSSLYLNLTMNIQLCARNNIYLKRQSFFLNFLFCFKSEMLLMTFHLITVKQILPNFYQFIFGYEKHFHIPSSFLSDM